MRSVFRIVGISFGISHRAAARAHPSPAASTAQTTQIGQKRGILRG
jgi:hypothetical protein